MRKLLLICTLMVGCSPADPMPSVAQSAEKFHLTVRQQDRNFYIPGFGPVDSQARLVQYFEQHPSYKGKLAAVPADLWDRMNAASLATKKDKKDWNITQSAANASETELHFGATYTDDRIFSYIQSSGTNTITSYSGVTNASPTQVWQYTIDAPLDHTYINSNGADDHIILVTSAGTVYSLCMSDTNCGNGTHKEWSTAIGHTVVHASPWVTTDEATEAVYVADESGYLTKLNASTGAQIAQVQVSATKALHSTPVEQNGTVFVGCDDGKLYRYTTSLVAHDTATNLSASGTPGTFDAIWSDLIEDGTNDKMYVNVNDKLWMIQITSTLGDCVESSLNGPCATSSVTTVGGTNKINESTPALDEFGGLNYIYSVFNGQIFRCAYTVTAGTPPSVSFGSCTGIDVATGPLRSSGNFSLPKADPAAVGNPGGSTWGFNSVLIGDGSGNINRFKSTSTAWSRTTGHNLGSCTAVEGYMNWGCFDQFCSADSMSWNCTTSGGGALVFVAASSL